MKRVFTTISVLFIFYFTIQIIFNFNSKGFKNTYDVTTDNIKYNVKEVYTANTKDEHDNYLINISGNNYNYNFQTYTFLKKANHIVEAVYSYQNCILPIFKDKGILFDITCVNNKEQSYYHNIYNPSAGLVSFAKAMEDKGYKVTKFKDNSNLGTYDNFVNINKDNVVSNHLLTMSNYKGAYVVSELIPNRIFSHNLLIKDSYTNKVSGFVNNYYVFADYDSKYNFSDFYVVDAKKNSTKVIETNQVFSYNSYVMGGYGDSIYFIDKDVMKQYEVNIKTSKVIEVGNVATKAKILINGKFEREDFYTVVNNNKVFQPDYSRTSNSVYKVIDTVGNNLSGFKYYYLYINGEYLCYKENVQSDIKTYIFKTTDVNNIYYVDDYVYYKHNDSIKYYQDEKGNRTLLTNSELKFNNSIKINVTK